jgi:hypothetical protein
MVIGPNGRELEAGPPGPLEDKPACSDLGAGLHSPHTPRELRWIWTVCCGGRPGERGIEAQKALTPVLTASDLDLSPLSRVCPGLVSRLWGGTQYDWYDPPTCARTRLGLRWDLVPGLLEAAFYLAFWYEPPRTASSCITGFGMECVRVLRTSAL